MRYKTTGGDIIITIPNCDCGLTGGCIKCQPIILKKHIDTFVIPTPRFNNIANINQINDESRGKAIKHNQELKQKGEEIYNEYKALVSQ